MTPYKNVYFIGERRMAVTTGGSANVPLGGLRGVRQMCGGLVTILDNR